jgi:hypothetical protein
MHLIIVVPRRGLLGEDAGQSLAIEIDPPVARAVDTIGQIPDALRIDVADRLVDLDLRILKLEVRQRSLEIRAVRLLRIAGLRHRGDERCDRHLAVRKVHRPDEIVRGSVQLVRKMMEHQDAAA